MSSNFFIRKSKSVKRPVNIKNKSNKKVRHDSKPNKLFKSLENEEISSEEESLKHHSEEESDDNNITAQEKKIIFAKKYLEEIEKEEKDRLENGDVHSTIINRLREDVLDQAGKLNKKVADKILEPNVLDIQFLRCKEHNLSLTCVTISSDNNFIYSASKDANIVKWSIEKKCKVGVILCKHKEKDSKQKEFCHDSPVLSLAVSVDGRYLASSDSSSCIRVWNAHSLAHIHSFKGHRSSVTGLAFCCETNNLYSCSKDRSIRIWNLDEMAFVETLFGHQCGVTDIDVLKKDRAVTCGGSDNTVRIWKVQEESQLIFNGHNKSIDRVRRLDQQHFVSCSDDGQVCVWGILKKKPLCTISEAHGKDINNGEANWITSVACFPNSDLIVSGSSDGHLRFWKCEDSFRIVKQIFSISVAGFINSIAFSTDGGTLVVGVGQEHRLGRWFRDKKAKNCILVVPFKYS